MVPRFSFFGLGMMYCNGYTKMNSPEILWCYIYCSKVSKLSIFDFMIRYDNPIFDRFGALTMSNSIDSIRNVNIPYSHIFIRMARLCYKKELVLIGPTEIERFLYYGVRIKNFKRSQTIFVLQSAYLKTQLKSGNSCIECMSKVYVR